MHDIGTCISGHVIWGHAGELWEADEGGVGDRRGRECPSTCGHSKGYDGDGGDSDGGEDDRDDDYGDDDDADGDAEYDYNDDDGECADAHSAQCRLKVTAPRDSLGWSLCQVFHTSIVTIIFTSIITMLELVF